MTCPFERHPISAATGDGLELLRGCIDDLFAGESKCDGSILTNPRQYDACRRAYESLLSALQGLKLGVTPVRCCWMWRPLWRP